MHIMAGCDSDDVIAKDLISRQNHLVGKIFTWKRQKQPSGEGIKLFGIPDRYFISCKSLTRKKFSLDKKCPGCHFISKKDHTQAEFYQLSESDSKDSVHLSKKKSMRALKAASCNNFTHNSFPINIFVGVSDFLLIQNLQLVQIA